MVADGRHASLARWLQRLPVDGAVRPGSAVGPVAARPPRMLAPPVPPSAGGDEPASTLAVTAPQPGPTPGAPQPEVPVLACRLLGRFEVAVDGRSVNEWTGNRSRLLLAYLLLHGHRPISCEALAVAFWPDASPRASRNRLHVTLHSVRRSLRTVTDVPVVIFARGYCINPALRVEVDVERFEDLTKEARDSEAAGDVNRSIAAYAAAVALGRGDLLEEAPYEEWTVLPREQHRVRFLQVLDRLAHLTFEADRYQDCVDVCQRLLAADYCREDVHRMLMRAYVRLNQPHLAIRQYKACVRQVRAELDVEPDQETQRLYALIRSRIAV